MNNPEEATRLQLQAIQSGLTERLRNGTIPQVSPHDNDFIKGENAAKVTTDNGLAMQVFANESLGEVESVVIAIDDFGNDTQLRELIQKNHGNTPVRGVEVIMQDRDVNQIGRARLINPGSFLNSDGGNIAVTRTNTYTYISPDVTAALVSRIPRAKPTQSTPQKPL